jgi:hypothetical protein
MNLAVFLIKAELFFFRLAGGITKWDRRCDCYISTA